jgi:phosphohistidine phosphatase
MHLYLVRHGLANWPVWKGDDDERPLTPEGAQQIRAGAAALAHLKLKPDLILHSPLARAQQTAEHVAEALGLVRHLRASEALRPGFDPYALRNLLHQHADLKALMLVGHAPDMAEGVQHLTGGAVKFKEGTVAHLQIEKPDSSPEGKLIWLFTLEALIELTSTQRSAGGAP